MNPKKPRSPCKNCDEIVDHPANEFCNNKCFWQSERKRRIDNKTCSARSMKRHLLDQGKQCFICKNTEWMGLPITLEIDHIDGISDNNEISNVRLLCPNCHSQTENYKAKNKGNGHDKRRKYRQSWYRRVELNH